MLFLPTGTLPPTKSKTGIVRGKWAGAYGLRARGAAVNARNAPQQLWRQVFASAKRNWLSIGPGGANNAPTNGIDPQTAWSVQSQMYFGIVQPGWLEGGLQTESTLIGCSTPEAYQVMVQNTFAALEQGQAPTPAVTTVASTPPSPGIQATFGTIQIVTATPATPQPSPLAGKVNIGAPNSGTSNYSLPVTISGAPAGCTALWASTGTTSTTLTQVSTISVGDDLFLTIPNTQATGTITLTLSFTISGTPHTVPIVYTVTTVDLVAVVVPPVWNPPNTMSAGTIYDSGFNVTGFLLTYTWFTGTLYQTQPFTWTGTGWGPVATEVTPGLWQVSASDQYTDGYAPPPASSWVPILLTGPLLPGPSDVLAAWLNTYEELNDKGRIEFQMAYIDPATGTVGPALSASARWQQGTLVGMPLSLYPGPQFAIAAPLPGDRFTVGAPSTTGLTCTLQTASGYRGTLSLKLVSKTPVPNGNNSTANAIPPNLTYAFSPATLTIGADYPTTYSSSLTLTVGAPTIYTDSILVIEATDGVMTKGVSFEMLISAGDLIDANYLGIGPGNTLVTITVPGTTSITLTLGNSGPDPLFVAMIALYPNADLAFTFTPQQFTVPAGTFASPGTTTTTLTIDVPATVFNPGTTLQVEAAAGTNTTYCAVQITL